MDNTYINYTIKGKLTFNGYCIKKKNINNDILNYIKTHMTVEPKQTFCQIGESVKLINYDEDDKYLILPKFVSNLTITKTNENENINIKYENNIINSITFEINKYKYPLCQIEKIKFNGKLRDYQTTIIDTIMNLFKNGNLPKGGIIKLSCGAGKTILAICLACVLGLKTLIVVHQKFLIFQWIEKIKLFTNAKVGMIRQNIVDIDDKDIVVSSLKSVSIKDYGDIFKNFGLVIYDEVHHLGSKCYSNALTKTRSEYTIGLSATPERNDGMLSVINWHIGNIIYKMDKKYNYRVLVKKVYFRSKNPLFCELKKRYAGSTTALPNHSKMVENLMNNFERNILITKIIDRLKSVGRKIFVFSSRVEHLEMLKKLTDEIISKNKEEHIYKTFYYIGNTKENERKLAEKNADIIFATLQLAEEGLDITRLDTVIYALPYNKQEKTLVQSIGRILRNESVENYLQLPLVIDICDVLSIYHKWGNFREKIYIKKKWYLQEYYWNDNDFVFNDDNKDKLPMNIMFDDIEDEDFIENNLILKDDEINETKNLNEQYDNLFDGNVV